MSKEQLLNKEAVKAITQQITSEQAEYVRGVKQILVDLQDGEYNKSAEDISSDIIFVAKIMAFADKFKQLHWASATMSMHKTIDEFGDELEGFKDAIAENIQSIIGQFNGDEITKLELPIQNDPLQLINEVKICVVNWFDLHKDDMEYEGCRNILSGFLETIHRYIYLFRLCKIECK